mmetsp:Transcript_53996/g.105592  ORF Transcript_53996/g.105592 Transcript_53996/m.105592 type:complete len:263 (+) Transcript_53996:300-1088(+)
MRDEITEDIRRGEIGEFDAQLKNWIRQSYYRPSPDEKRPFRNRGLVSFFWGAVAAGLTHVYVRHTVQPSGFFFHYRIRIPIFVPSLASFTFAYTVAFALGMQPTFSAVVRQPGILGQASRALLSEMRYGPLTQHPNRAPPPQKAQRETDRYRDHGARAWDPKYVSGSSRGQEDGSDWTKSQNSNANSSEPSPPHSASQVGSVSGEWAPPSASDFSQPSVSESVKGGRQNSVSVSGQNKEEGALRGSLAVAGGNPSRTHSPPS